ncbi:MAG: hypothetical protein H6657_24195 [Ardenticatenaceae bacterium]|nr:hypothetical protein [Anaerolineales bacterium]MCB8980525.1 hypothetical protein [Ardenticatenaceae bacterium]
MLESYALSFGQIIKLQDNLVEVIVDENVEFNMTMIHEYHSWLLANLKAPFAMLINKIHPYTYTFDAQISIGNLPEIKAMAVLSYSKITEESTNVLISMPRSNKWNIQVFQTRDEALDWLKDELDKN